MKSVHFLALSLALILLFGAQVMAGPFAARRAARQGNRPSYSVQYQPAPASCTPRTTPVYIAPRVTSSALPAGSSCGPQGCSTARFFRR